MDYLKRFWNWLSVKIKEYWNLMLGKTTIDEQVVEKYNEFKDKVEEFREEVQERVKNVKEEIQDVKDSFEETHKQAKDVVTAVKGKKRRGRPKKS